MRLFGGKDMQIEKLRGQGLDEFFQGILTREFRRMLCFF